MRERQLACHDIHVTHPTHGQRRPILGKLWDGDSHIERYSDREYIALSAESTFWPSHPLPIGSSNTDLVVARPSHHPPEGRGREEVEIGKGHQRSIGGLSDRPFPIEVPCGGIPKDSVLTEKPPGELLSPTPSGQHSNPGGGESTLPPVPPV